MSENKEIIYTLTDEQLKEITGGEDRRGEIQKELPCPRCKTTIHTTMLELMTADRIVCPHCGLMLSIDRSRRR